jgi:hypothetical protein
MPLCIYHWCCFHLICDLFLILLCISPSVNVFSHESIIVLWEISYKHIVLLLVIFVQFLREHWLTGMSKVCSIIRFVLLMTWFRSKTSNRQNLFSSFALCFWTSPIGKTESAFSVFVYFTLTISSETP